MARKAEEKVTNVLAIMNERDFEMVKTTLADGILFPTETVAQAIRNIGKNYYLPTVTACFDPSAVYAKPMPAVIIDNRKVVNTAIDYLMKMNHKIGMALPLMRGTRISGTSIEERRYFRRLAKNTKIHIGYPGSAENRIE